ncbi:RNA demethylase ALKBH5-like [Phalaenopsis equestris]|uniref:RNA demethylase ALKBH5-like n=1 Tax=Phalaenopsis equestris TaxID=78828 RepID=UPI0009E50C1B|nr:RNA demethylase ALKBH5-like [Phalaenopsis equestris]
MEIKLKEKASNRPVDVLSQPVKAEEKDKEGNLPRIICHDKVFHLPSFIKKIIKLLVTWHILPADCIPNSCIINIYEAGDCIPPHVDRHDFVRPVCTVSFINKCNIMFRTEIQIVGDGEFQGFVEIPLPVGSILVLKGNGADVAKHCIPGVLYPRNSITLKRMNEEKVPFRFRPDPKIEYLQPFEL